MPFCAVSALVSAWNSCSASGNGSGRFRLSYGLLCIAPSSTYDTPNDRPPASEYAWPPLLPPMLRLVAFSAGCGTAAGRNCMQVGGIPAVERQVQDPLVVHHLADAEVARLDHQRVGLNGDVLGDLAERQGDVDDRVRADLQHDAGLRVGAKPCSITSRRYGPTGRSGSRYAPSASVTVLRLSPVSVWVTVTSAPGSTPPLPILDGPADLRGRPPAPTRARQSESARARRRRSPPTRASLRPPSLEWRTPHVSRRIGGEYSRDRRPVNTLKDR